jgi:predicted molibdopterin-dependent oxidoreductase YjgC
MRVLNHPILGPFQLTHPVEITVDGQAVQAFEGETIAAAMMASGIRIFRRTEHGGPRGIFCAVGRCSDCLMVVDGVPNVRVCVTAVRKGMKVETQTGKGKVISHDGTL